jgi:hypothetical protein
MKLDFSIQTIQFEKMIVDGIEVFRLGSNCWFAISNSGSEFYEIMVCDHLEKEYQRRKEIFNKKWMYIQPSSAGPNFPEYITMTGKEIYDEYWDHFYTKMIKKFGPGHEYITLEECIYSWVAVHWAWEVKEDENPFEYDDPFDLENLIQD